jgi:glycosyltransferase involved in cell wall biosynthesis
MISQITPVILTYNEAPNIRRTIDKLLWARRIIVIDSGSTDETIDLLKFYPQVEVFCHPFANYADQWTYGLAQTRSSWVLSLDADYELSDELIQEIRSLVPPDEVAGYRARFIYRIDGRPLRGSLYPPRTVLHRKDRASYRQEGHKQQVVIDGKVLPLRGLIYHDDRKPLARWLLSQSRYAQEEAKHLLARRLGTLSKTDRIRLMGWPAPIGIFFYTLFVNGCVFDGWRGWYYALQRVVAEILIALEIIQRRSFKNRAAGIEQ